MAKYVIIHGSLKTGANEYANVGDTVELEEDFVKEVDPKGVCFVTEEKYLALEEKRELEERIATMSDEEKLDALKAAVTKKSKRAPKAEAEG